MIVVDAGVIVALVCDHPLHHQAMALLEEDPEWIAPLLWQSEVRNVIGQKLHTIAKIISEDEAIEAYQDAVDLLKKGTRSVDPISCMKISLNYGISGYDAEYVALSQEAGVDLMTTDQRLLNKLHDSGYKGIHSLGLGQDG